MKRIQQIFKWTTLLFFVIAIHALTIGQIVPIEIADWHDMHLFYDIILQGLPIAVLLTLVWTLQKEGSKRMNIAIGIATPVVAAATFFGTVFLMFSYGFGAWVDEEVIYENKSHREVTINQQLWDMGALGYGGQRTVKLTPFMGFWNLVKEVDTTKIEQGEWTLIQKEGDIKLR